MLFETCGAAVMIAEAVTRCIKISDSEGTPWTLQDGECRLDLGGR